MYAVGGHAYTEQGGMKLPGKKNLDYDLKPFQELLGNLLEEADESYRQAGMASGLSGTTVSNYMRGTRPMRDACIALADHFGINPNKMLEAAGYEPLRIFERQRIDLSKVDPDTKRLLEKMEQITDPEIRKRVYEAIDVLLEGQLRIQQEEKERMKSTKVLGFAEAS
jgi:transcriptional regulator with XRE-family HTH domain